MQLAHVITIRDGRVSKLVEYFDRAEGLRRGRAHRVTVGCGQIRNAHSFRTRASR